MHDLQALQATIDQLSPPMAWLWATSGFAAIYVASALGALVWVRWIFPRLRIGRTIDSERPFPGQIRFELSHSAVSIAIFGLYGVATLWLHKHVGLPIQWSFHPGILAVDLIVFALWNEVHFYACHRLLHTRWLYGRVHRIHHKSVVPTPFSTYSFHWFEAALLGSVMITGMLLYRYSFPALLLAPLVSLAMNTIGHWNYDPVPSLPLSHPLAASRRHSLHHGRVTGNFGFMLPYLDAWLRTALAAGPRASPAPTAPTSG